MPLRRKTFLAALLAVPLGAGATQAAGFDPRENCATLLNSENESERMMIASWTFGFVAARSDGIRPVDGQNNATLLANLQRICAANQGASLLELVEASTKASTKAPDTQSNGVAPGSEAQARAVLEQFLAADADYRALTQALFPTEAEVRTVYADPLASALVESYHRQMGSDVFFAPKADQNAVLMYYTTTKALAEGDPVLDQFPGGYKDVLGYFKADVPIVRFKFVKQGEQLGLAFDGLIYVNDHWVIMPKPWRSLPG